MISMVGGDEISLIRSRVGLSNFNWIGYDSLAKRYQ